MPLRKSRTTARRGAKETIRADAPAFGLALAAAGVGVWLAVINHPEAKAIGTGLLVVGVLLLTSRWFGLPVRWLKPGDPTSRHERLRASLTAAAIHLEYVVSVSTGRKVNPAWLFQQAKDRPADAYRLLSEAIVPPTADDFAQVGHDARQAAAGRPTRVLDGLAAQAAFLRSLADNVEAVDLMPDWQRDE